MARAAFPIADRVSLADVGEHMKRKNDLHEGLARDDVQAALVNGCGVELIWLEAGQEVCRQYPEPAFFRRPIPILSWYGVVPRRLHIQLPPEEQKGDQLVTFLRLTDAVRYGLRPASELPQAQRQPPQMPPATRLDEPAADLAPSSAPAEPLQSPATATPPVDRPMAPAEESRPAPALPSMLAVSKPALSSLEVPASVSPPPQEPTPIALLVEAALVVPATESKPKEPEPKGW